MKKNRMPPVSQQADSAPRAKIEAISIEKYRWALPLNGLREAILPVRLAHLFGFLLLFACFYGLSGYGIFDDMEGLYAAVARDMLHGGDYIIPHVNGVSYLEKPPMLYWLMAYSFSLLGENELAARLPVVLALAGLAVTMAGFLRAQGHGRAGIVAGIMMVTAPTIIIIGRSIYCDTLLTFFCATALLAFFRWLQTGERQGLVLSYAMVALAVLTKGFIAVILTGGTALLFMLARRTGARRMLRAFDPPGIAVFLLIAAPWHVAAALREPGFTWFYFVNEHVLRFLGTREPHDYPTGPLWYYIPVLALNLFPWSVMLGLARWRLRGIRIPASEEEKPLRQFLWIWFAVIFVFFSLSKAKAYYFMMMGLPPLIMLAALYIAGMARTGHTAALRRCAWEAALVFLLLTGGTIAYFVCLRANIVPRPDGAFWRLLAPGLLLAAAVFRHRDRLDGLEACIVPLCLPILVFLPAAVGGIERVEQPLSQKQPAAYLLTQDNGEHIALYHDFDLISALAFYLPGPLPVIDSTSPDLAYGKGRGQRPDLFPTWSQWIKENSGKPAYLVARNLYIGELTQKFARLPAGERLCLDRRFADVAVFSRCRDAAQSDEE